MTAKPKVLHNCFTNLESLCGRESNRLVSWKHHLANIQAAIRSKTWQMSENNYSVTQEISTYSKHIRIPIKQAIQQTLEENLGLQRWMYVLSTLLFHSVCLFVFATGISSTCKTITTPWPDNASITWLTNLAEKSYTYRRGCEG